jgi:CheY-like chemotaxis protein
MPTGGSLTIETGNLLFDAGRSGQPSVGPVGPQVCLSVTDSGVGMDEAVLQHLFEPFFTTKEVGKGTGLGLAAVHGIVTQCDGSIDVQSAPGKGTTFRIYFPRRDAPSVAPDPLLDDDMPRGSETILIVEDETPLRMLARTVLESCGYSVLDAVGGSQALAVSAGHDGAIDLLLADVVMPVLNGRQVAEALLRERPGLKVLYTSGYTDDMVLRYGVSQASVAYLPKPFTPVELAQAVRRTLDQPVRPPA